MKIQSQAVGYATVEAHAVNATQFRYAKGLGSRATKRRDARMNIEQPVRPASREAQVGAMSFLGGLFIGLLVLIKKVCG